MNHDLAARKGIKFTPSSASVKHAGNSYMDISGITRMRFTLNDTERVTEVYLVRDLGADILLDYFSSIVLGIISKNFPEQMPPCHHCDNRMEPELQIGELLPPTPEELSSNGHVRGTQQIMKTSFTENESTLTKFMKKTYKDVISDELNPSPMAGTPMHIYLKEGLIVPDRVTTARVIPKRMEAPRSLTR